MSAGDNPVYCHATATTGMLISGKMSVGVRTAASTPPIRIRIAITTKVYGRDSAIRTIAVMRAARPAGTASCQRSGSQAIALQHGPQQHAATSPCQVANQPPLRWERECERPPPLAATPALQQTCQRAEASMTDTATTTADAIPRHHLFQEERRALAALRAWSRRRLRSEHPAPDAAPFTLGQKVADQVAAGMGSWPFIIVQSALLAVWIVLNVVGYVKHWDPYPFILLNLALSFQAAYAAPFIMMSQNRQAAVGPPGTRPTTTRSTSRPNSRSNCCTRRSTNSAKRRFWL